MNESGLLTKAYAFLYRLLFGAVFLFFLAGGISPLAAAPPRNVLILNSYHQGYKWTDDIVQGIKTALAPAVDDMDIHVVYMDSKRFPEKEYFAKLLSIYRLKYDRTHFDVIISADDNAFNFLRSYRDELFPGTPVVFCGVNYFEESDLDGLANFTGVNETADIPATVELMLSLHPTAKKIFFLNDATTTGKKVHDRCLEVIERFAGRVEFAFLDDLEMGKLRQKVRHLPPESLILYNFFFRDSAGQFFEYDDSIKLIAEKSNSPVYGSWDFSLGHGIIGGMLTSGFYQGETAGKIALRILDGENAKEIPVVIKSPNRYMFDYDQFERFGISLSKLPAGATVINRPITFLEFLSVNRQRLLALATPILVFVVIFLIFGIRRITRARTALEASEIRLRTANTQLKNLVADRNRVLGELEEKTTVLEEKNEQLEQFNKLFVGRELRMAELKERIEALEKELA